MNIDFFGNNSLDKLLALIKSMKDSLTSAIGNKSKVTFTKNQTSGEKIGTINIDGINYDIYAPSPTEQVQADWDVDDSDEPDYIKNKPDLKNFVSDSITTNTMQVGDNEDTAVRIEPRLVKIGNSSAEEDLPNRLEFGDTDNAYVEEFADDCVKIHAGDELRLEGYLYVNDVDYAVNEANLKMLGWTVPTECPIQNELDGNTFIQKIGRVNLGDLDWSGYFGSSKHQFNSLNLATVVKKASSNEKIMNLYCSKYKNRSPYDVWEYDDGVCVDTSGYVKIHDANYSDISTFANSVKGVYLYYELANPVTIPIDGNEAVASLERKILNYPRIEVGKIEQGAISQELGKEYNQIKVSSLTRIRCTNLIVAQKNKSYDFTCNDSYRFVVVGFNSDFKCDYYGSWTNKETIGGHSYYAFALRKSDNTNLEVSAFYSSDFSLYEKDAFSNISDEWKSTKSYVAGDFCIYQNVLYKVKASCTGVTPPNSTYYEPTSVGNELSGLREWIALTVTWSSKVSSHSDFELYFNPITKIAKATGYISISSQINNGENIFTIQNYTSALRTHQFVYMGNASTRVQARLSANGSTFLADAPIPNGNYGFVGEFVLK